MKDMNKIKTEQWKDMETRKYVRQRIEGYEWMQRIPLKDTNRIKEGEWKGVEAEKERGGRLKKKVQYKRINRIKGKESEGRRKLCEDFYFIFLT